jgi:hypothetical protein
MTVSKKAKNLRQVFDQDLTEPRGLRKLAGKAKEKSVGAVEKKPTSRAVSQMGQRFATQPGRMRTGKIVPVVPVEPGKGKKAVSVKKPKGSLVKKVDRDRK